MREKNLYKLWFEGLSERKQYPASDKAKVLFDKHFKRKEVRIYSPLQADKYFLGLKLLKRGYSYQIEYEAFGIFNGSLEFAELIKNLNEDSIKYNNKGEKIVKWEFAVIHHTQYVEITRVW